MSEDRVDVFGGVDTGRDIHVGAVVDTVGRVVGSESFVAEATGYEQLVAWLRSKGHLVRVGVEGTGSYGAGLARYLTEASIEVVEVNRPNRQLRRLRGGKSDSVDAEGAARAAASGEATAVPKSGVGPVECIRMLLVARRSATKARTQAANQIHSLVVTAPEQVKRQLAGLKLKARVRVCARWRPGQAQTTVAYAKKALRHLARRYQTLDAEINQLEADTRRLCARANPALLAAKGVGPDTASVLLVAAGDNPGRMKSEKSFAALCGASPVQASSGQIVRHRLNQGGKTASQQRAVADRHHPDTNRPCHPTIRRTAPGPRKKEAGDHPLPQAAHRPTDLPPPHQPATNPELRPPTRPASTRRYHHHPGRPSPPNTSQPHLRTRARPRPQPPTRHPLPEVAPHPPPGPTVDLTTIGASSPVGRFGGCLGCLGGVGGGWCFGVRGGAGGGWSCPAFSDTSRFVIHRVVGGSFRSLRVSGIRWLSAAGGGCRNLRCSRRRRSGPGSGWRSWSGPGVRSRGWRRTTRLPHCRKRRLVVPSILRCRLGHSGPGTPPRCIGNPYPNDGSPSPAVACDGHVQSVGDQRCSHVISHGPSNDPP